MSRSLLKKEIKYYVCNYFIETGTDAGGGVEIALLAGFKNVISIEFSKALFDYCKEKFKDSKKVKILYGDSSNILKEVLPKLKEPATIFLDAHTLTYNPIFDELSIVKSQDIKTHTILIDDLRTYGIESYWKDINISDIITKVYEINLNYNIGYMRSFNRMGDILVASIKKLPKVHIKNWL